MRAPLLLALLAASCSAAPPPAPVPSPAPASAEPPIGPARWLLTDSHGVLFDEAGHGTAFPRPEPALLDGVRLLLDNGVILASAPHADRLIGFRSLPERLGGGYLLWSDDRTYRASAFLDDLRPVTDAGATGGARPWLTSVLLRTPVGLLDLDPVTFAVHRAALPGIADALAIDDRRGVRVDALGRASYTVDGGKTFTDVLATRGLTVTSLRTGEDGAIVLATDGPVPLVLGPTSDLHPLVEPSRPPSIDLHTAAPLLGAALPATSRALPPEIVAQAAAYGVPLPGGRLLVARENGIRVLALTTALPVADLDLPVVDPLFGHCQAVSIGDPARPALACAGESGAEVLGFDRGLGSLALDATFPRVGAGFIAGPRGRLAISGRCGPGAPSPMDLGSGSRPAAETLDVPPDPMPPPPPPDPDAGDLPHDDDARVCVRAAPGRWIEHRLRGEDARRLYRWVPGDDGTATAIVLAGDDDGTAGDGGVAPVAPVPERVRVVRVDPVDPALHGGSFPALMAPSTEPPYRVADGDFWQDDDGALRGWVRLPPEGEEEAAAAPSEQGQILRVTGRAAGVRIDAAGHLAVLPLPEGTTQVAFGGRFGLATASGEGGETWFETLDGGATWTPVEGPPVGKIEPPSDEHTPFACSAIGCALGGVVRIGWGGPRPHAPPDLALAPAPGPKIGAPAPLVLACRLEGEPPWPATKPKHAAGPAPIALRLEANRLGALRDHTWTGEVIPPFQPTAATLRVTANDRTWTDLEGRAIPVLSSSAPPATRPPVDLLLLVDKHRLRAGGGGAALPFDTGTRFGVAAALPGDTLALLDANAGVIALSRGAWTAAVMRLARVPDVSRTRLTLARRRAGGIALVGYSTSTGEVFAGDLDLGRAEVGPLGSLGRLDAPAACGAETGGVGFVAELPARVRVTGPAGATILDEQITVAALVEADAGRLCVRALEAALPRGSATVLDAVLGKSASASVRSAGKSVRASCTLGR